MKDTDNMVLKQLISETSGRIKIKYDDELIGDLMGILSRSGLKEKFCKKFITKLKILCECGDTIHFSPDENFEWLKGVSELSPMCSLHVDCKKNAIRILYTIVDNNEIILLCAFKEQQGENQKSYPHYIPVAIERFNNRKKENKNEKI